MRYFVAAGVWLAFCLALGAMEEPFNAERDKSLSPENGLWLSYCIEGRRCVMVSSHEFKCGLPFYCNNDAALQRAREIMEYNLVKALTPPYKPDAWRCNGSPWHKFEEKQS